jgi:16S rRNA (guanine527-N7)-methyltransferase
VKRPGSGTVSRETRGRLEALAGQHALPEGAVATLTALLELQASDPAASTTVRDPAGAADRHVADSLSGLALDAVRGARRVADIGSGAGWPGLALAVALPDAPVALVESATRHCRYLSRAVEVAGLANVSVVHARAEQWVEGIGVHDLVTARALAALPVLCEYAAPLLAEGGWLVAWKGAVEDAELADGRAAAEVLGLEPAEPLRVVPYAGARDHTLHAFCKIAPTPERFPRRAGMAVKRPLSAAGRGRRP